MRRGFLLTALLASSTCGCATSDSACGCAGCQPHKNLCSKYIPLKDDLTTKATAIKCADDSLKELKDCGKLSKDYKIGFRDAYVDQAFGRPLTVPPVPPRHYWTAYHRSCAGQEDVAQWFEGYRAGLEIGATSGIRDFHRVKTSWNCQSPGDAAWSDSLTSGNPATIEGSAWGAAPMTNTRPAASPMLETRPAENLVNPHASYRANTTMLPVSGTLPANSSAPVSPAGWSQAVAAPTYAPNLGPPTLGR